MNGSGCFDALLFLPLSFSGLSYDTNEVALKDAFSQHGDAIQGTNLSVLNLFADY